MRVELSEDDYHAEETSGILQVVVAKFGQHFENIHISLLPMTFEEYEQYFPHLPCGDIQTLAKDANHAECMEQF